MLILLDIQRYSKYDPPVLMSPITRLFVDAPLETRVWALVNQWGESGIFAAFPVKAGLAPSQRWGEGCFGAVDTEHR
jgi:hypothetical protein